MPTTIVSDTSCLILLEKIGELELLHSVFGEIVITNNVASEYRLALPEWIVVKNPSNQTFQRILHANIDIGEASAIALALELTDCLLIIDDAKGRNLARELGIALTGTLGVFLEAKRNGLIDEVGPMLIKIQATDFRLSSQVISKTLKIAGEK